MLAAALMAWSLCLATSPVPGVNVPRLSRPPALDGRVAADPAWQPAAAITNFRLLGSDKPPKAATRALVGYTARGLWVGFVCQLPGEAKPAAAKRPRDSDIWQDESVEVFLSWRPDGRDYCHFIVNATGSVLDELADKNAPAWNARWSARVSATVGRWEAEIFIPWCSLPIGPGAGPNWRANFTRHCKATDELITWGPCRDSFHEPGNFGWLRGIEVDFTPMARASLLGALHELQRKCARVQQAAPGNLIGRRARGRAARAATKAAELAAEVRRASGSRLAEIEAEISALRALLAEASRLAAAATAAEQARRVSGQSAYVVSVESSMTKIPADAPYKPKPALEALVELARGEREAIQLVVIPLERDLRAVAVKVSDLRGPADAVLPAQHISVRRIGYVEVKKPTRQSPFGPGLLPDPLLPYQPTDVRRGSRLHLLLTVHAPRSQRPGTYTGTVEIAPAGEKPWRLKLRVRVWGFELPRQPLLRTSYGLYTHMLRQYHDVWDGKTPPGWQWGVWVGDKPDVPNYFGQAEFDHGVAEQGAFSGRRCAWISCTAWQRGSREAPRAALMFKRRLEPGKYRFSFAYRTADAASRTDFGISGVVWKPLPATQKWRRVDYAFTVKQARDVWFYLRLHSKGHAWFDAVSLRRADSDEDLAPNGDFERIGAATLDELVHRYILNMLDHRASPTNVAAPRISVDGDRVSIDWAEFDRRMEEYIRRGLNAFNISWSRIRGGWGKVAGIGSDRARRISAEILRQTERHLRERGWLELAYLYCIDEPSWKYFPQVREIFDFVHRVAPGIKRLLTYGYGASRPIQPGKPRYADLAGYVDIHVPHSDCFEPIYLRKRQELGEEVWVYVCISAQRPWLNIWAIDYPGTDHRVLFWQIYRAGATGFLYWSITYWKVNPWQDAQTYPGGNGDGSLLYPGRDGPVDSLRWEITRDGMEDYDYLKLAEILANELEKRGRQAIARQLRRLCRTDDVTRGWLQYTEDPQVILAHRRRLGRALEEATACK